jgi:hypothetical protein
VRPALTHLHCPFPRVAECSKEFEQELLATPLHVLTCTPWQAGIEEVGLLWLLLEAALLMELLLLEELEELFTVV